MQKILTNHVVLFQICCYTMKYRILVHFLSDLSCIPIIKVGKGDDASPHGRHEPTGFGPIQSQLVSTCSKSHLCIAGLNQL
jgi:hypothetical protein